jgi:DNA-binding MarR family transcriptional regulator
VSNRIELLTRIAAEAQRHYAAYTLFNQALADRLGLHPTDLQCVSMLDQEPDPVSTTEVARLTGLTPGSATRLIDRLEKVGLVVRNADQQDRRKSMVTLAAGAHAQLSAAWEGPGRVFGEALAEYSEDELAVIGSYLRRATEVGLSNARRLHSGDLLVTRFQP